MLNRGYSYCYCPKQDKQKSENARHKSVASWRATRRLEGNKLKEEAEPRDYEAQDDDRDTGSEPREESALGSKENAWVRGWHPGRQMRPNVK